MCAEEKEEYNHKGVKDALCYYNDTIVCLAFAFFARANSTSVNDNNDNQGANYQAKH